MRTEIFILIMGMSLITYIPRVIPGIFINHISINDQFKSYLKMIPYAALGALIFPGILSANSGSPLIGLICGAVAVGICLIKKCMALTILICIIVANLLSFTIFAN